MAYNPPIGSIYHLYTAWILPSGGLYATYHLLGEPETTFDIVMSIHEIVWMAIFPILIDGCKWSQLGGGGGAQHLPVRFTYQISMND